MAVRRPEGLGLLSCHLLFWRPSPGSPTRTRFSFGRWASTEKEGGFIKTKNIVQSVCLYGAYYKSHCGQRHLYGPVVHDRQCQIALGQGLLWIPFFCFKDQLIRNIRNVIAVFLGISATGTMKCLSSIGFFYRLEMIRTRISCPRLLSMANLTRNCGVCKLLLTIVWPSASRHLPINGKIAPQRVLISFFDILYPSEKEIIISLNAYCVRSSWKYLIMLSAIYCALVSIVVVRE